VAGVNVALGLIASEAASRRDDDRTFLVSMALLASAGFLQPGGATAVHGAPGRCRHRAHDA
jgi:hypothetical protein